MKREIKFRGENVSTKEWVKGLLFFSHGTGIYKITYSNGWNPSYSNPDEGESTIYTDVIPETIGQYTGLKDKDGNEIYEGDFLELANGETVEVSFKSGKFVGIRKNGTISLTSFYWIYAKIVGNVYKLVSV